MREIKFRVWSKDSKRMYKAKYDEWCIQLNGFFGGNKDCLVMTPNGNLSIFELDGKIIQDRQEVGDDYILMQYTGLKDKNGKEIYEGDILYHKGCSPKEYRFSIIWKDYKWKFENLNDKTKGHPVMQLFRYPQNFEIIGNIYENPDLLTNK